VLSSIYPAADPGSAATALMVGALSSVPDQLHSSENMKLAVTGFVSEAAGSVASANALLIRELLRRGHEIHFFSKPSFVDPRPAVGRAPGFRFFDVTNVGADRLRQRLSRVPVASFLAGQFDASSYNRLLVQQITANHAREKYDVCFWMGDYARGRTPGLPTVCFVQGAPGSDARSILRQSSEVKRLAGAATALKWQILAKVRLSPWGLPPFGNADHLIVGSSQSKRSLHSLFGIADHRVSKLPYPIDLELFNLQEAEPPASKSESQSSAADRQDAQQELRICWLGRIVPRKRLDLFLDGAALAIRKGIELRLTIVGGIGFIQGYEKMIEAFPFRDRLTWRKSVPRKEVPQLLHAHDLLVQPSDDEDFGSSVAEAQACGLPVIVGETNGNADYLCSRDIHLKDDRAETLCEAYQEMSGRKARGQWGDPRTSRECAERNFSLENVATSLIEILKAAASR
jgi:glycosyltransferase involved in cell wall biosynthesis